MEVDPTDWDLIAGMGSGEDSGLKAAGIRQYEKAVAACDVLTTGNAAAGAKYKLDDLSVLMCLSQHKEVIADTDIPEPPPPVTVPYDLGLDDPGFHAASGARGYAPRIR